MTAANKTGSKSVAKRRSPARRVHGFGLVMLSVIAATMMFALPAFMILVIAAIPPLVAYYTDRDGEKYAAVAVGALSFSGAMPDILELWLGTFTVRQAALTLADPFTWLAIYGAAAAGWLMYFLLPLLAHSYLKMSCEHRMTILQKECAALAENWGAAIAPSVDKP